MGAKFLGYADIIRITGRIRGENKGVAVLEFLSAVSVYMNVIETGAAGPAVEGQGDTSVIHQDSSPGSLGLNKHGSRFPDQFHPVSDSIQALEQGCGVPLLKTVHRTSFLQHESLILRYQPTLPGMGMG
jgi:hypothetical protein